MYLQRITTLFAFICSSIIWAQDPYYINIDKTKGLPSNSVYDIYQDSKGFMWFATDEGLCRYDGKNFKSYTSPALTSRSGTCIKEDRLGRIWYTNFDNKVYYLENEELKDISQNTSLGIFSKYHVMGNWLLIPQVIGLDIYDLRTMKLHETLKINEHTYTVGSGNSFFFQDMHHNVFFIDTTLKVRGIGRNPLILMAADNGTAYFTDKQNRLKKYNSVTISGIKKESGFEYNEYINNVCVTNQYIWICTKNGCFTRKNNSNDTYQQLFRGKYISCVIKDKDNNYWIGTTNEGLMFIPSIDNRFYTFPITPDLLQVTGDQLLFAGKGNCLYEMDLNNHEVKEVFKKESNHEVSCFYYDEKNKTTLVCSDMLYEISGGKTNKTIGISVKEIAKIDDKYYSIPSSGVCGFYRLSSNKNPSVWDDLQFQYDNRSSVPDSHSAFLINVRGKATTYDEKNKIVYIVSGSGVYSITPKQIKEVKYNDKTIHARKIKAYKGNVVILQNNGIILLVNNKGEISEHPFIIKEETVAINKIVLRKNILFLITNGKGVYYLNMNCPTSELKLINEVPANEDVVDIEIWNNQFLITCSGGLLMMDANRSFIRDPEPKLVINNIEVNNKQVDITKEKTFRYTQNNFHINYSILSFNTRMNYPLYYRINNKDWKLTASESRELELASLSPGDYIIDFRLGNTDQYSIQSIKFTIKKPIWQIQWFWIGLILIVIIIAYIIYKLRLKKLNHRNRLLSEKIELEKNLNRSVLTSIKAQMNPHFFYNALNTIQSFIFADDKKNASVYLSKFSKLTRLLLEMSEKEQVLLSEEILALNLYLDIEKIRFNNKLNFEIIVEPALNVEMIKIPTMIVQSYVENAIKHGLLHKKEDCRLLIEFSKTETGLKIVVDDNGIGRTKSGQLNSMKDGKHPSFSTSANQKRLEILNRDNKQLAVEFIDKYDQAGNSTGTTVIISLPVQY